MGLLPKVIPLELFLDMVPSSSEDVNSRNAWTADATFFSKLPETKVQERYFIIMFWFRFTPEMFSAFSAAFA